MVEAWLIYRVDQLHRHLERILTPQEVGNRVWLNVEIEFGNL